MNIPSMPPPIWVDTPSGLQALAEALMTESVIAVDTESNSLYAYQEQVCLIQFSTPTQDYLLDSLALTDLSVLAPIFASLDIEKIFHAAEYDLICLHRDFGFTFASLFDTMWAARLLGYKAVGLGALLQRHFGVEPDKRYQRANWGRRPLSPEQLTYAQLDTHYLIPLRNQMQEALKKAGMWELAKEDFDRFCRLNHTNGERNNIPCWQRIKNARKLTPRQAAILQELCAFREKVARRQNRPRFKVIGDKTLLQLAQTAPQDWNALHNSGALSRKQIERYGRSILRAIQRGVRARELYAPSTPRPSDAYLFLMDAMHSWRKETARRLGVESDVVLPRNIMQRIVAQEPHTLPELAQVMEDTPWRFEHFGAEILDVILHPGKHA